MEIKILGTGCPKCTQLYENAQEAINKTKSDATLAKISDLNDIMAYGVMITPAVVIDGEVKSTGKLCTPDDIAAWIK